MGFIKGLHLTNSYLLWLSRTLMKTVGLLLCVLMLLMMLRIIVAYESEVALDIAMRMCTIKGVGWVLRQLLAFFTDDSMDTTSVSDLVRALTNLSFTPSTQHRPSPVSQSPTREGTRPLTPVIIEETVRWATPALINWLTKGLPAILA